MNRLVPLLRDAWSLAGPYWQSQERGRAWALLVAVVGLNLGLVGITVLLTYWQRAFYNALEAKDWAGFIALLFWWRRTTSEGFAPSFALLATIYIVITT